MQYKVQRHGTVASPRHTCHDIHAPTAWCTTTMLYYCPRLLATRTLTMIVELGGFPADAHPPAPLPKLLRLCARSAARTFDITLHMKDGSGSHQFVNLQRSVYKELLHFLTAKQIRIKNVGTAAQVGSIVKSYYDILI